MDLSDFRPTERPHLVIDSADPRERARLRGRALELAHTLDTYDRLFRSAGLTETQVRDAGHRALDIIASHRAGLAGQILGLAQGAGLEPWQIAALNARTEILAQSASAPGECSTVVQELPGRNAHVGVQTWDWHVELSASWHTVESGGADHRYAGLTEHGILAKIGVNSAGLALHFNILGHRQDRLSGVPMHILAATVLEEAESPNHAQEIVRGTPVTSSGSLMLFTEHESVLLDISPEGVYVVPSKVRTNHFLTERLSPNEKSWLYQPDSTQRRDLLLQRLARATPRTEKELLSLLVSTPEEASLTCLPDFALPLGRRWASLATVLLDPGRKRATILDGTPAEQTTRPWYTLQA
ncbi:C45 family peptidase [Nocardiopsis metallicus]|uniref:C45 family peptidase n=1 Tax=Nocardiopsis metallicus TaxID=179819 RepID=UPI0031CFDDE7